MKIKQKFTRTLLHPRYWLTWFSLGILFLLVQLPYPLLMKIGSSAGRFSRHFLKRRVAIARRNLELCFPDITAEKREAMIVNNFSSLGMALVETGMAWFWSDRRVRHWFDVSGLENLQQA
ncbi:kdo(2)-lipid IV(A) palmitoleoyltransferase, partial [Brenneria goodwinii]|nr:kdo(2)-lipid IV(A) palmitoleoyltransferase [Brenneria goodwinii]